MVDLINIGKSGVLNAATLLNTTANNINNATTEGYTRKVTVTYTSTVDWGVGDTVTTRVVNVYTQRELYSDQALVGYYTAYSEGLSAVDTMITDDDMSVANAISDFFDSLADAVENPTSTADREEAMASLATVLERFITLNTSIADTITDVNSMIKDDVATINTLTASIQNINAQIKSLSISSTEISSEIYQELLDERDRLINELSSLVDLSVVEQTDGTYAVYMSDGQLLANGESYAVLSTQVNEYDSTKLDIYLSFSNYAGSSNDNTYVKLDSSSIGGELGGYLESTDELRQTMRELGQLAVAFADALNVQNEAGVTLEGTLGEALITLSTSYATSTNSSYGMSCSFIEGSGSLVTSLSFKVLFVDGEMQIYSVDDDGNLTDITDEAELGEDDEGMLTITLADYGVTFQCNASEEELLSQTVTFYISPTLNVASTLSLNITKAEDFAFASSVSVTTTTGNIGNAVISLESCTATGDDMGVTYNSESGEAEFTEGAPTTIIIDEDGNYEIYDSDGNYLGEAPASCNGQNIFANAVDVNGDAFDRGTGYPGYEVSITGTVNEGDSYSITVNTDGYADNSNGVFMTELRTEDLVRLSNAEGALTGTFAERYADIAATLGSAVSSAESSLAAAEAKCEATETLYESESGVSLDEEAANLLLYQQAYQACAKIIEAAQTVFDALIAVV